MGELSKAINIGTVVEAQLHAEIAWIRRCYPGSQKNHVAGGTQGRVEAILQLA